MRDDDLRASLEGTDFQRLYDYWCSRHVGNRLPGRGAIDPMDLPELLPRIYLIDVFRGEAGQLEFRFRLAGTEHFEINQIELTGRTVEEAFIPERVAGIKAAYARVAMTRQPLLTRSATAGAPGREHMIYDRLLLPLASDGQTVDMILGCLRRTSPHK